MAKGLIERTKSVIAVWKWLTNGGRTYQICSSQMVSMMVRKTTGSTFKGERQTK
jgi:hypothetical protein